MPAFTFVAPASAVLWPGATPIFADVDPRTLCLDPQSVHACITPKTRAVVPVHLFGHAADMTGMMAALKDASQPIAVVEDLGQAWGAMHAGRSVGTVGAVSFFPTKNLGGLGDGGAVIAPEQSLNEIRALRRHGCRRRDYHDTLCLNARLGALQAAMLSIKLKRIGEVLDLRRSQAEQYREALADCSWLGLPPFEERKGEVRTFNQFVVRVPGRRDVLKSHLDRHGIMTRSYYPMPLPAQPVFRDVPQHLTEWPVTAAACLDSLALPLGEGLDVQDVSRIAETVRSAVKLLGTDVGPAAPEILF